MPRLTPVAESEAKLFSSETRDYYQFDEFAIVIKVTRLSCDGHMVTTNEFTIIFEDARLSCDVLVIVAQPDCTFRPRLNLV